MRLDMTFTYPNQNVELTREFEAPAIDDVFVMPTSASQQRFWVLDQLEPGNTSLNMPLALKLSGRLVVPELERTLNEIVSRHEVLRTTFSKTNGKPVQIISAEQSLSLEVVDLSNHPDKENEANRLLVEEAHHKFNLSVGPLLKTKLIRLDADNHILLLTMHHIVCDGWSNGVLVREIGEIYDAFSRRLPLPNPELPIQYADFAYWQQDWLKSDGFEEQLAYWKRQLGNKIPPLELPTDFPRNKNRGSFGAIESLLLPRPLTRAVKTLSQREDVTPFMIFFAAFNVLLHRYTGRDDILIGSPTANRQQGETEGLIGPFANTLLLKTDLSGSPTFKDLLLRVKEVSLGAFSNQTLPFEKLVETVRPATNGRRGGQLFQVLFIFQTAFMKPVELKDLSIEPIRSVSPGSIFELSLGVVERHEGTRLQLEYNTDLFKADTISVMLEDLHSILQSAVLDNTRKASELLHWTTPLRSREMRNRAPLPASVLPATDAAAPNAADHEGIEGILTRIWQDVLHVDSIQPNDDFFELGGHSLLASQLFDEIAKRLAVNLPLATLFTATTVRQLAELIRKEKPKDVWTSLVPINSQGTKPPLFLMHAAGGNVLFYKELSERLGSDQPCYGMQAVGLNGHQSAYDRIEDMAAHYIKEIRGAQPKGPYYLGGSSVGGLIAYEVAQQLQKSGEEVKLIVLFDTAAPGYPIILKRQSALSLQLLQIKDRIHHHAETIAILEPGKRWPYIRAKAKKAKNQIRRTYKQTRKKIKLGVLSSLGRDLPDALTLTQNAISKAVKTYAPSSYSGDILLFRATKQQRGIQRDDTLGWSKFVAGNLEIHELKGDHGTLVVEPRVRFAAAVLEDRLSDSAQLIAKLSDNSPAD